MEIGSTTETTETTHKRIVRAKCKHCGNYESDHTNEFNENNIPHAFEPRPRGFAAMTPEQRSAIASRGGKAAHLHGHAHKWNSDEARKAGKLGGKAPHKWRGPQRGKRYQNSSNHMISSTDEVTNSE